MTSPHRFVLLATLGCALMLPPCAIAQAVAGKPASASASTPTAALTSAPAEAVSSCERAVRDLLATKGNPSVEVSFNAPPALQRRLSGDEQMVLRGGGSWRGAGMRTFDYTCNVDPRTFEAVGMVMRDTSPASAKAGPASTALEPDLTHLSPTVCESAIAATLKKRWPRVSEIGFESATRTVKQTSPRTAELHGRGRALPVQGAPHSHFGFNCEFDTRDGRLLGSRLSS